MKPILIAIAILLGLTSCKSIDSTVKNPQTGMECNVKYNAFGMSEIKDMSAEVCGGKLTVGSSSTDTPSGLSLDQVACLYYGQCGSKQ